MTKETRKSLLIMLVCVVTVPVLLFKGCTSLGKTIYTSMDCDRFNIDHIEMRTGIDIQQIQRNYCRLSSDEREVSFKSLKDGASEMAYAQRYFTWDGTTFSAIGSNPETNWYASLDTISNELYFRLNYITSE